jgi:hypothetical protein
MKPPYLSSLPSSSPCVHPFQSLAGIPCLKKHAILDCLRFKNKSCRLPGLQLFHARLKHDVKPKKFQGATTLIENGQLQTSFGIHRKCGGGPHHDWRHLLNCGQDRLKHSCDRIYSLDGKSSFLGRGHNQRTSDLDIMLPGFMK